MSKRGEIEIENRELKKGFASDNNSGVLPELLDVFKDINLKHCPAYGDDPITQSAEEQFKINFGKEAQPFFVFNGSAANVLGLSILTEGYHSVLCAQSSHINQDECGAPERIGNCKLIPIPTENGKLTVEDLERHLVRRGDQHYAQIKVVSITQPTELGTVYMLEEVRKISEFCKKNQLYLHMDGARLPNAALSLNSDFEALTRECGVDALSFGGTKNGFMFGEALVVWDDAFKKKAKFLRKQFMQLAGKMRFLSGQFDLYLKKQLWKKVAHHENQMAELLAKKLREIPDVQITQEVQANAVFAKMPKEAIKSARNEYFFYVWDENTFEVRLMTNFDTQESEIEEFTEIIRSAPRIYNDKLVSDVSRTC